MSRVSKTAQIDAAVEAVLLLLKRRGGDVPYITRSAWREAVRLLRLDASNGTSWRAHKDMRPYLEAAGRDEQGQIVDYEKWYAYLEAHARGRKANKGRSTTTLRLPKERRGPS